MTPRRFRLVVAGPAKRDLARLPEKATPAVIETFEAIAANPHRVGKPLKLELAGRFVARRGPYRVIYTIDGAEHLVVIRSIGHRDDVYRRR